MSSASRIDVVCSRPSTRLALRRRRFGRGILLALCLSLSALPALAHQNAPGVLAIRQVESGRFLLKWSAPSPEVPGLTVHLPERCLVNGAASFDPSAATGVALVMDCGTSGLGGELRFEAPSALPGHVAANVRWLDGSESFRLSSGAPARVIFGAASPNQRLEVLQRYLLLGIEHIWFGLDHLLFLLGLLILVRGLYGLLTTITAFTLAHSITLALASLQVIVMPAAPVEICIALSILLLAVEASRGPRTAGRRWPWMVAFGFGLLHGLGFASALSEVGLPKHATLWSLLGFNAGVEIGQLIVVSLCLAAHSLLSASPLWRRRVETAAVWGLGSCSVFWLLQRLEHWLKQLNVLGAGWP